MTDPFIDLADRYVEHYGSLRGQVRHRVVRTQLDRHLPSPPIEVVDLGGGAGHIAIPLARTGYRVTLVDPSATMLDHARDALADELEAVRDRVTLVEAADAEVLDHLQPRSFDAVVSHGVLPYVDSAARHVATVTALLRHEGVASLVFKNRDALAMRGAIRGEYEAAIDALDAEGDVGGLGGETKAQRLDDVLGWLASHGVEPVAWYGIRMFTDHLDDHQEPGEFEAAIRLELAATHRDPYRRIGRLLHVVARRVRGG